MKAHARLESVKDFYCSYCGEKIVESESAYLIQYDMTKIEIRHVECLEENLK